MSIDPFTKDQPSFKTTFKKKLYMCILMAISPFTKDQPSLKTTFYLKLFPSYFIVDVPCGSTGTSSGNCQETETCMVWACHMPKQPLQNHSSGYLGGWKMPWSAEEMLNGQHQRLGIPAHAKTANKGIPQKRLPEDLC